MIPVLAPGRPGGPHCIAVHGLEGSWPAWQSVADALGPRWRFSALDLPWRAGSNQRWPRHRAVQQVASELAEAGADGTAAGSAGPPLLLAHSLGANVAIELLTQAAAPSWPLVALFPLFRGARAPVSWESFDASRRNFEATIGAGVRARLGERSTTLDATLVQRIVDRAIERVGPCGLTATFDRWALSADFVLEDIVAPLLVVASPRDSALSPGAAGELVARVPHARLELRDELDHFAHLSHPGEVADLVEGFWSGQLEKEAG